jgi:flavin-dependent dehydrogenase
VKELDDRVQVETQDGRLYAASYLIGADGANSVVARALGLRHRRTLAAAVEAEVPVTPEVMRRFAQRMVFIFGEIHYGYLWIFPKQDHLTIGIGALHPKPGELQQVLKEVASRYGISLDDTPLHGHPIPIYTRREPVSSTRTLLVGDAAGIADPLSGEGIRFAIKSGRLAAESILSGHPESYPKDLHNIIGLNHRLTLLFSMSFYFFQAPFLLLGTPNPFSTQAVVEMLADRMTATEFILFGFLTLPIFIATELVARFLRRLGQIRLSDRIRARIYPEDVSESYR